MRRPTWLAPFLTSSAVLWCVGIGLWIWFTPVEWKSVLAHNGVTEEVSNFHPFSESSEKGALPLIVPVAMALFSLWSARGDFWAGLLVGTLLLTSFSLLASWTIGAFYFPAVLSLILATALSWKHRSTGSIPQRPPIP